MATHDPSSREDSYDEAPRRVQDDVSELLRSASYDEAPRMPQDIAARIRAAMASEFGTTFTTSSLAQEAKTEQTPIIVPLPARPPTSSRHSASSAKVATSKREAPSPSGATVHSFEAAKEKRAGRRRNVWAASAAAAAVVVGGSVGVGVLNGQSSSVAGKATTSLTTQAPAAPINVSDVRITQTNTKYSKENLISEAQKNATSTAPLSSSVSGDKMTTKKGVNSCIAALDQSASPSLKSVHADFGTYSGQLAVIVTLNYGTTQKVWVVQRSCTPGAQNVIAGPYKA